MKTSSGQGAVHFIASLLLILSTAGCFRVGLPERFADTSRQTSAKTASVLIVLNDDETDAGEILGAQYLFGIIPFTGLYLEHGATSALRESWFEELARDSQVYLTLPQYAAHAMALLKPSYFISANLRQLSVNGFDALFFRVLSIAGQVQRSDIDGQSLLTLELEENHYAPFAHLDTLSDRLQKALVSVAIKARNEALVIPPLTGQANYPPLVVINPVEVSIPDGPALAEAYLESYGSHDSEIFSAGRLGRLIQRGLSRGVRNNNTPVVEAGHETVVCAGPVLLLNSALRELVLTDDTLDGSLTLEIKSCGANAFETLARLACQGSVSLKRSAEGWLPKAVENFGLSAASALLAFPTTHEPASGLRCSTVES